MLDEGIPNVRMMKRGGSKGESIVIGDGVPYKEIMIKIKEEIQGILLLNMKKSCCG